MNNELIIAIDPSFTNTGITIKKNDTYEFFSFESKKNKIGKKGQELKTKENDITIFCYYLKGLYNQESLGFKNINVVYADMFSHNINTTKSLYKLVGIIELVFDDCNIHCINEKKAMKNVIGKCGRTTEENKKLSTEYFKKEMEFYAKNDDIADSFIICKWFEKIKKE